MRESSIVPSVTILDTSNPVSTSAVGMFKKHETLLQRRKKGAERMRFAIASAVHIAKGNPG